MILDSQNSNQVFNSHHQYHTGDPISITSQIMMMSPNLPSGSANSQQLIDQIEQQNQLTATKAKMQQQIRQLKHMEQLEVKTISERSHEDSMDYYNYNHISSFYSFVTESELDSLLNIHQLICNYLLDYVSMSLTSSRVNTPGGHHKNYLSSGGIQRRLQGEINDIDESAIQDADQQLKSGLKIGEADEHKLDETDILAGEGLSGRGAGKNQEDEEAETEQEENKIIEQIMQALQVKDGSDMDYNSVISSTDGIYLQNINSLQIFNNFDNLFYFTKKITLMYRLFFLNYLVSEQLESVIKYLYHLDDPDKCAFEMPQDFRVLMNLFETAEYLGMDRMKVDITVEICKKEEFLKYTNIYENLNPDILMFVLTDPALQSINHVENWAYINFINLLRYVNFIQIDNLLGNYYANFTRNRIEYMERMKDDDSFRFVFDEDLQFLPKEYYEVYNDTVDNLQTKDTIIAHLLDFINLLREDFRQLPFDFHSCFYYDVESKQFKIHRKFLQQDDFKLATNPPPPFKTFRRPLILFSAFEATNFAICLTEIFSLSKRFSQIRILNLRGFVTLQKEQVLKILQSCDQVAHLNLSFVKSVDDEVADYLGSKFQKTLISLEMRACSNLTDKGIINLFKRLLYSFLLYQKDEKFISLCEGLSGIKEKRNGEEFADDYARYKPFNRHETVAKLRHLNLADLKQITNKAMKSISFNLFPELVDLSIWGCYKITNEGFLELCTAHRSDNFRRVNYCGCYKISDDSRLWISSSFSRVIIYNKVDDFGKELDLDQVVPPVVESHQSTNDDKQD